MAQTRRLNNERRMVVMTRRPPGLSTRCSSARTRPGCSRKNHIEVLAEQVKVLSGQGSCVASPWTISARPASTAWRLAWRAVSTISGLWSRAATRATRG